MQWHRLDACPTASGQTPVRLWLMVKCKASDSSTAVRCLRTGVWPDVGWLYTVLYSRQILHFTDKRKGVGLSGGQLGNRTAYRRVAIHGVPFRTDPNIDLYRFSKCGTLCPAHEGSSVAGTVLWIGKRLGSVRPRADMIRDS